MPDAAAGRGRRRRGPFRGRRRLENQPAEPPRSETEEISRPAAMEDIPRSQDEQQTLPDGTALLRVYRRESAHGAPCFGFVVNCFCAGSQQIFDNLQYGRPNIAINDNVRHQGPPPGEYLRQLRIWSAQKGELTRWLYDHRSEHRELTLVIWDDTGYRIPWELLWLPPKQDGTGPERGFLGAVLTVTRRVSSHVAFPEVMRAFTSPDPYRARGPVAAYFAQDMASDAALFADYAVDPPIASMEDLFANLATESGPLSMVYVACHGTFSDEPDEFVLGGLPYGRAVEFDYNLPRLYTQPALVFLNSCVSGLESVDTGKYNDGAQRGFAEVFLYSGAAGVLATTGAVGRSEAREFADDLFKQLKADPELYVAEAVRRLRAQALNEMNKNPHWSRSDLSDADRNAADRGLLPLLYPFMYVYFGSPRLLLSPSERQWLEGTGDSDGTGG